MMLYAIDPGSTESALVIYDLDAGTLVRWRKASNHVIAAELEAVPRHIPFATLAVEMIASYGMPVGAEVFETCMWVGRFVERWERFVRTTPMLVYRREVKLHLCQSARAKDANVRQALIDRFGPGKELAVGRKATPGPLFGLSGDGWAALGVAVTAADTRLDSRVAA